MNDKETFILDAAEDLFATHGFQESSIRAIANRAGVSSAMLSYYFGSKEKLLEMVLQRGVARFEKAAKTAKLKHLNGLQKLEAMMDQQLYLLQHHAGFFKLVLHERFFHSTNSSAVTINGFLERKFQLIKAILIEAITAHEIRLIDVELTSAMLLAMFFNCAIYPQKFISQTSETPEIKLARFCKRYLDDLKIK